MAVKNRFIDLPQLKTYGTGTYVQLKGAVGALSLAVQALDEEIDSVIATVESDPATEAHPVGDYILYSGKLYKVTAAIAVGDGLVVGKNIARTTVADSLKTIPKMSFDDESKGIVISYG